MSQQDNQTTGTVNPVEVEKELLNKQQFIADSDPAEAAAKVLHQLESRFENLISGLSSRQLRRCMKAIVMAPFIQGYKPSDKLEKEAFMVGDSMMQAKMVLLTHLQIEEMENEKKAAEEKVETVSE